MGRARILIVEDEVIVAANLEAALEDLGYTSIGIAPDSETALRLAAEKPDLALVDVNLRDGPTGPQIAARLAEEHGVAILFVTANPRMIEDAAPTAIGVLSKPCDDDLVGAAVSYAIGVSREGRACETPPPGLTLLDRRLDAGSPQFG